MSKLVNTETLLASVDSKAVFVYMNMGVMGDYIAVLAPNAEHATTPSATEIDREQAKLFINEGTVGVVLSTDTFKEQLQA
ncbi:hypothetical protein [Vibrio hangzhouensis]|uniref:Uncharacterized protein n=1 Tax=Vibrio hangzhouensis TaxID=462991 RepID=A0A1H5YC90_9VIBR|nr:hypothetical protein [Vibrio hangzhouensis]SEG21661.1 hypothetical protein SAMN04488244_10913 [Vibrio hangzhouensis]